jgi:hypothetical protein
MTQDFTTTILVEQSQETAYNTILDVRSWWSGLYGESFEGNAAALGDEFSFLAGDGMHHTKQKLVALVPGRKVVWLVTEANLSFVDKTDEWKGTRISFDISEESGKTKIVFTQYWPGAYVPVLRFLCPGMDTVYKRAAYLRIEPGNR